MKLTHLVVDPTEAETDDGILKIHKLRADGDSMALIAMKDGVRVEGFAQIQTRQDLDTFAKAMAMAWKDYEYRKVRLNGLM
jgi:hypothetical protein